MSFYGGIVGPSPILLGPREVGFGVRVGPLRKERKGGSGSGSGRELDAFISIVFVLYFFNHYNLSIHFHAIKIFTCSFLFLSFLPFLFIINLTILPSILLLIHFNPILNLPTSSSNLSKLTPYTCSQLGPMLIYKTKIHYYINHTPNQTKRKKKKIRS